MLFPTLGGKKDAALNLNDVAREWATGLGPVFQSYRGNPFLDPKFLQRFVDLMARARKVDWLLDGWLQDRRYLWATSVIAKEGAFIHLGVDLWVPAGTPVAHHLPATVLFVDDDKDQDCGWGPRVFLRPDGSDVVLLFAHLGHILPFGPGDRIEAGQVFAQVGAPPHNGNWAAHLHLQALEAGYAEQTLSTDPDKITAYCRPEDVDAHLAFTREPLQYVIL